MSRFIAGAAAIAFAAAAVSADPGGGKGGGHANGGGKDHAGHPISSPGKSGGGGQARDKRSNGADARGVARTANRSERGDGDGRQARVEPGPGRGNDSGREAQGRRNPGGDDRIREARGNERGDERIREVRGNGKGRGNDRAPVLRDGDTREMARARAGDNGRASRDDRRGFAWRQVVPKGARGIVEGCPPGLAKKGSGCMPPGLVRAAAPAVFFDNPGWWNFDRQWYVDVDWDERYRYYDGYLVEYDDSGIEGWIPLLGGALAPGNLWPTNYEAVALPDYYQEYYGLGPVDSYRYYDDALYRVDPQSDAITSIVGLLTGDDFAVGQHLPGGYDVYNVPYSFRGQYVDGPDANYRYSDGYVYQVDPTTQLIEAAFQLLT